MRRPLVVAALVAMGAGAIAAPSQFEAASVKKQRAGPGLPRA